MSFSDVICIEDEGADPYGDPEENASIINEALETGQPVYIPAKPFPVYGKLTVKKRGQEIFGHGQAALVQCKPNEDVIVTAQSAVAEVKLRGFCIIAQTGVDFSLGGDGIKSVYSGNMKIEDVFVVRMHRGVYVDTQTNIFSSDIYLDGVHAYDTVSDGIVFNNVVAGYATNSSAKSCGGNGFKIVDGSACHLNHVLSLSNAISGVKVLTAANPSSDWHFFDQVECDGNAIDGYRFFNVKGLQASNCWAGTSGQIGWNFLSGNSQVLVSNSASRKNGAHGFYGDGLTDSGFDNCAANWNGQNEAVSDGTGIMLNGNCYGVAISNPIVSEVLTPKSQAFGIRVCGTSAEVQVTGGRSRGNLVAQYQNISSGSGIRVSNLLGYN